MTDASTVHPALDSIGNFYHTLHQLIYIRDTGRKHRPRSFYDSLHEAISLALQAERAYAGGALLLSQATQCAQRYLGVAPYEARGLDNILARAYYTRSVQITPSTIEDYFSQRETFDAGQRSLAVRCLRKAVRRLRQEFVSMPGE